MDQPMDSAHNFSNYSNSSSDTGVSIGYPTKMGDWISNGKSVIRLTIGVPSCKQSYLICFSFLAYCSFSFLPQGVRELSRNCQVYHQFLLVDSGKLSNYHNNIKVCHCSQPVLLLVLSGWLVASECQKPPNKQDCHIGAFPKCKNTKLNHQLIIGYDG